MKRDIYDWCDGCGKEAVCDEACLACVRLVFNEGAIKVGKPSLWTKKKGTKQVID